MHEPAGLLLQWKVSTPWRTVQSYLWIKYAATSHDICSMPSGCCVWCGCVIFFSLLQSSLLSSHLLSFPLLSSNHRSSLWWGCVIFSSLLSSLQLSPLLLTPLLPCSMLSPPIPFPLLSSNLLSFPLRSSSQRPKPLRRFALQRLTVREIDLETVDTKNPASRSVRAGQTLTHMCAFTHTHTQTRLFLCYEHHPSQMCTQC